MGVTVTTERENGILKAAHLQRTPLKHRNSGGTECTQGSSLGRSRGAQLQLKQARGPVPLL